MRLRLLAAALLLAAGLVNAAQQRILILGDSITYDGRWTARVESALRATPAYAHAVILNLGLPSETASGLSEPGHAGGAFPRPCVHDRLAEALRQTKPTLVIACYGMNDGIYQPLSEANLAAYRTGMEKLVAACTAAGARVILLTPPLHAADRTPKGPGDYDRVLDAYADWLRSRVAAGWAVVDIRPGLRAAIAAEKTRDPAFRYAPDDVHPGDVGHGMIADAVLSGLWPKLKLGGKPKIGSAERLGRIRSAQNLLRDAWLTKVGHKRPGIPGGLPVDQAEAKAAELRRQAGA